MSGQEIELKLRMRPEDLPRLRAAPVLSAGKGRAVTRELETVYFDTADLRLHGQALSLRVRRQGRRYVQTLKSAAETAGMALARGEWEAPVAGAAPDLSALPEGNPLLSLGPLEGDELRPVFEARIRRTVRTLVPAEGQEVEVAIDQGEIRTADGQVLAVHEIELELKNGSDPRSLYEIALALNAVAPLRVETRSKAERGYALAAGTVDGPVKATKLVLGPQETVESAMARIVRHCIDHLVANEACALAGENPEGIHQVRVALRRLRSALQLFRDYLPPAQYEALAGEVKWLADACGQARDWDVFLGALLAPVDAAFPGEPALRALDAAAQRCRALGYDRAAEAIRSPRYTALLLKLGAWVDGRGWRDQPVSETSAALLSPVQVAADRLLDGRHRQARKRGRRFASLAPEARHRLRIALKKLRYAADFFRGLYDPKAVKKYADDLAELQDALGHLQDVATVHKLIGQVEAELGADAPEGWRQGAGMVLGWHGRGLQSLEPRLVRDWEAFAETRPFWSEPPKLG